MSPIPNSPWFLVAHMEISEVYAPLRERFWAIIILVVVLLIGSGASVGLVWRSQRSKFYIERHLSTESIRKLNRVYAILSDINEAIVRIRNPQELFVKACDIAVEKGGFQMAWIGKINSQTKKVDLVASQGVSEAHLKNINFNYDDDESQLGIAGLAIKNGVHVISNDIQKDENILPQHKESPMYGSKSSAAFPLKVFGQVWGVFNLYSHEIGFFDKEELKLLDELAMDISFAIEFEKKEIERQRAEESLTNSETRYRRLFESAKDGILILDAETGKIVDVNPFLIGLLGYSKENFIEKEIWEIGFFKDIVANYDKFLELQHEKYVRYEDLPLETVEGRKINVEFVSNVYLVDHKNVIQCNIRDITQRKRAEEALRESEEKYRNLVEYSPDAVFISQGYKIIFVNQTCLKLFGANNDQELIGKNPLELFHPDFHDTIRERMRVTHGLGQSAPTIEEKIVRLDGSVVDVEVVAAPFQFNKENVVHVILRDITERKRAEEALRESEEMLLRSQEIGHLGSWEWDIVTNKVEWSAETFRIYGYQPNEIEANYELVLKNMNDESRDEFNRSIEVALKGEKSFEMDYTFFTKNKDKRILHTIGNIKRDEQGNPLKMYGIVLDITERKRVTR